MSAALEPSSSTPGPRGLLNGWRIRGGSSQTRVPKMVGAVFDSSGIGLQANHRRYRGEPLLPLAQQYQRCDSFASAHHLDRNPVARLLRAQSVSKIVQITDRLAVELN